MISKLRIIYLGQELEKGGELLEESQTSFKVKLLEDIVIEPGMEFEYYRLAHNGTIKLVISKPPEELIPLGVNVAELMNIGETLG
jgi:hypothetical protein